LINFRTKSELSSYGAVDTTPRLIKKSDRIDVQCEVCNIKKNVIFSQLRQTYGKFNRKYQCRKCTKRVNPLKTRDSESLRLMGLVDTKPRAIRNKEKVDVNCAVCKQEFNILFKSAFYSAKRNPGSHWKCRPCSYATKKPAKSLFYTKEALTDYDLADVTPRHISAKSNVDYRCTECNEMGNTQFQNIKYKPNKNRICLACSVKKLSTTGMHIGDSKPERELKEWLMEIGILDIKKIRIGGMELDIYLESLKIGIEMNGLYWHSEAHKSKDYHLNKTNHFNKLGIRVIHIFHNEWNLKKDQVKSYLRSALGMNTKRIYARKCEIRSVDKSEAVDMLNKYHIQGRASSVKEVYGLYYEGEIQCLASFGVHHRNNKEIVLNRFVSIDGVTVVGGLSRLVKRAKQEFNTYIVSWCDRRLSDGKGYVKSGWVIDNVLSPDYFYTKGGTTVISKQSRIKSRIGTPDGMTEHEHATKDGLFRVYDCGKIRFIHKL